MLTPEDIKKHTQAGILAIQIRAQDTTTAIVEIPTSYLDAVEEVAKR